LILDTKHHSRIIEQPAVSNKIRQLEEILGANLFERTPTGVEPNSVSKAFYLDAVNVVRSMTPCKENILAQQMSLAAE